jgi:hypothetical protein
MAFELAHPEVVSVGTDFKVPKLVKQIREQLLMKIQAVNYDLEISECLKTHKMELLGNLLEE